MKDVDEYIKDYLKTNNIERNNENFVALYMAWGNACFKQCEHLEYENEKLKAENAALRERLDKAVELKAKIEDTVFMPWAYDGVFGIAELQVCAIHFLYDGSIIYSTDLDTDNDIGSLSKYSYGNFLQEEFGSRIFNNPEAAEARLKELKGEKE